MQQSITPGIAEARPPYVRFERRALEDRAATLAAGCFQTKDVDFALITPRGSKDRIEQVVSEWFEKLEVEIQSERYPLAWFQHHQQAYAAWAKGEAIPDSGTPIKTWPALSPSQIRACLDLHVTTVEDLAAANEEIIMRLGLGGRTLVQRASQWLDTAKNVGKVAEETAALKAEKADLQAQVAQLTANMAALEAKLAPFMAEAIGKTPQR